MKKNAEYPGTYGLEIWGSTKPSNINRIQFFQSKVLRKIVNAPLYVPNRVLHKDLNVPTVADLAWTPLHSSFHLHTNPLVQAFSGPGYSLKSGVCLASNVNNII